MYLPYLYPTGKGTPRKAAKNRGPSRPLARKLPVSPGGMPPSSGPLRVGVVVERGRYPRHRDPPGGHTEAREPGSEMLTIDVDAGTHRSSLRFDPFAMDSKPGGVRDANLLFYIHEAQIRTFAAGHRHFCSTT